MHNSLYTLEIIKTSFLLLEALQVEHIYHITI